MINDEYVRSLENRYADLQRTVAELRDQVENRTCERDLEHHGRLTAMTERDRLREADARVRELHQPHTIQPDDIKVCACGTCDDSDWPCATIMALDGTDGGE